MVARLFVGFGFLRQWGLRLVASRSVSVVVAYVVVHGVDQVRNLCGTASDCLELVKTLQARAEAPIEVLDGSGAKLRVRDLEALHKDEVEKGPPTRAGLPVTKTRRRRSLSPGGERGRIAAGLLIATAIVAIIAVTGRHYWAPVVPERGVKEALQDVSREGAAGAPAPGREPEAAGGSSTAEVAKDKSASGSAQERMGSGEAAPSSYTVVANDTLRGIAKKLFHDPGRWRDIARANPNLNPDRLRPGQVIALPEAPKLARHR
ncbi:LysM peptidoglycan-binding domain-containing protein [Methylocystis sp. MJC1]|jgi:hypothetical protein|uniref:LysM peptidoglycan-binding domain-containing protein n=1 Tax=Methylocystis sp. MJC1 TaxID=2654282 RepID=UPI001FF041C8|nr:LysM peptidoglycan-binding domain-containing protein [Methylocystis sp. MJC1]KAF2990136.1 hypothetical protein MJC1_02796 [Methylocystis sp. MJC1]UZX10550.1 LysM peptidoglycan-binding domain-containing protein [Methylocystis sp. MJC1]